MATKQQVITALEAMQDYLDHSGEWCWPLPLDILGATCIFFNTDLRDGNAADVMQVLLAMKIPKAIKWEKRTDWGYDQVMVQEIIAENKEQVP